MSKVAAVVGVIAVVAGFVQVGSVQLGVLIVVALVGLAAVVAVGRRSVFFLGKDEQLIVQSFTETRAINGPGMKFMNPVGYKSAAVKKALTLGTMNYAKVKGTVDGSERVERGPKLLFLGAYEEATQTGLATSLTSEEYILIEDKLSGEKRVQRGPAIWYPGFHDTFRKSEAVTMTQTEYVIVEDRLTGDRSIVKGPCVWFPGPYDNASPKKAGIALQDDEYVRLKDTATGRRWVEKGKCLIFCEPTWVVEGASAKASGVQSAWVLKAYEYVRLLDSVTGKVVMHKGEKTVFPGPDEELLDGSTLSALDLKVHEYVKILDQGTGVTKVVSGPQMYFLGAGEKTLDGGTKKAVVVDEEHAVLVRDKSTGTLRLVKEKSLFIPGPDETIEKIQELIKLADHEAMIIKNGEGVFSYYYGSDEKRKAAATPRSFFLEPYHEVVKLLWSRGTRRDKRDLVIERFDCRAQYMYFEFNCRTSDNVELVLEGTFFWEVVDLPAMVQTTGDLPGDICAHARSQFIKQTARATLKEFMESQHDIAKKVYEEDKQFYQTRGVKIHSLEVTRYACADASTSEILEQIIQETTNRMNRLSQAEGENEVKLFRMQGQIEQEKLNGDLLEIQHQHAKEEAEVKGKAEGIAVTAFVAGLQSSVPDLSTRTTMWRTLRKTDSIGIVSQGGANLYYTPKDVDLSITTVGPNMVAAR